MTGSVNVDPGRAMPDNRQHASAGGIVVLALGVLLTFMGLGGVGGGIALSTVIFHQDPNGFISSPTGTFSTEAFALTSPPARIEPNGILSNLGTLQLNATSTTPDGKVFIGVGPKADVDRFLSGVHISEVTGVQTSPFRVSYHDIPGNIDATRPDRQNFWAVSASGPGTQQITLNPRGGDWVVVIMNSDAQAGITADVQAAVKSPLFGAVTPALWLGGLTLVLIGAGLAAVGATLLGRRIPQVGGTAVSSPSAGAPLGRYPIQLTGHLDPQLSRGLWLVKWLLAVPHVVILAGLWLAVLITTIISGIAILFTGRYPRPLFNFAVGVLRWNWRVTFYAYSALATDKYPPFTLASTDYPADLVVLYPQQLSHGLVLVKSWLLAIPHLIIIGIFTNTVWLSWNGFDAWSSSNSRGTATSLLGILVLIAAVILLFTNRYPRSLFDLIMGINRWTYRVAVYVLLLRDDYPPFRLDQGATEPTFEADSLRN